MELIENLDNYIKPLPNFIIIIDWKEKTTLSL